MEVNDLIKLIEAAKVAGVSKLEVPGVLNVTMFELYKYTESGPSQDSGRTTYTTEDDSSPVITKDLSKQLPKNTIEDASSSVTPLSVLDELTDEEILYYSTPHYDELMAIKERTRAQVESEKDKA